MILKYQAASEKATPSRRLIREAGPRNWADEVRDHFLHLPADSVRWRYRRYFAVLGLTPSGLVAVAVVAKATNEGGAGEQENVLFKFRTITSRNIWKSMSIWIQTVVVISHSQICEEEHNSFRRITCFVLCKFYQHFK